MTNTRIMPFSSAQLWRLFHYNNGKLIWIKRPSMSIPAGSEVGYVHPYDGLSRVRIDGVDYQISRIIWTMFNGKIKNNQRVFHINGIKSDNNILNLKVKGLGSLKGESHAKQNTC